MLCCFFCLCLLFKSVLVKAADGADEVFGREFARFIISPGSIEKFTFTRLKKSWVHDSVGKNGKRLREENSIEA